MMEAEVNDKGKDKGKEENIDFSKIKKNPWMIVSGVLALIIIILIVLNFTGVTGNVISEKDAGNKVVEYGKSLGINDIEIVGVEDEGSFYAVSVSTGEGKGTIFITKDGKYHIQPVKQITGQTIDSGEQPAPESQEVPKSDKPKVELFVMSFCPYGNRAEDTMLPVYELLKDKVDWNIHYIVSVSGDTIRSLHGQPETDQNIREVCVLNEYGLDKFWEFTTYVNKNCGSDGSCWKGAVSESKLSINNIQNCFDEEGLELMKAEAQISGEAGASGSPTLLINGIKSSAVYQYGNSDAYKQAICSAFNEAPEECEEELSGSTSTSAGGSC